MDISRDVCSLLFYKVFGGQQMRSMMMKFNVHNLFITMFLLIFCCCSSGIVAPAINAADWYVRPFGGSYGAADGQTYDAAFNGLGAVEWVKVKAGDTLWVCGEHDQNHPHGILTVGASGTSGSHITIRGDCKTKNAGYINVTIWNVRTKYPVGFAWSGPDAFGAYSAEQYGQSNDLPAIEDQSTVLKNMGKVPDGTWTAGSYYHLQVGQQIHTWFIPVFMFRHLS
jgi:hypothetical protein